MVSTRSLCFPKKTLKEISTRDRKPLLLDKTTAIFIYLDLYLARLITSKQIIQPYVDQFFNSILLNQPGAQVPPPIKYLFDFLDQDAIQSLNNQLHNQHNTTLNNVSFCENIYADPLKFNFSKKILTKLFVSGKLIRSYFDFGLI